MEAYSVSVLGYHNFYDSLYIQKGFRFFPVFQKAFCLDSVLNKKAVEKINTKQKAVLHLLHRKHLKATVMKTSVLA